MSKLQSIQSMIHNWFMVCHEAVDSFEPNEYMQLQALKELAQKELNNIENILSIIPEIEWKGRAFETDGSTYNCCPRCYAREDTKHDDDCEIGQWMKEQNEK